jgi:hypothetical protein
MREFTHHMSSTDLEAIRQEIFRMSPLAAARNTKFPLLTLPKELIVEVASHLESFEDLNSLVRTTSLFHTLLNPYLYRRFAAAKPRVRDWIVESVLSERQVDSLALLLDHGLSVHHTLAFEDTEYDLLRWICEFNDDRGRSVPLARLLVERGANVDAKNPDDSHTALHATALDGKFELAEFLLAHGADPITPDENGCTPLYWVSRGHQSDDFLLAKSFLEHGADVNAVTSFESCPLLEAFHWDRKKIGALLLEHGADANVLYRLLSEENIEHAKEWVEDCRSNEFRDDDFYRVSV